MPLPIPAAPPQRVKPDLRRLAELIDARQRSAPRHGDGPRPLGTGWTFPTNRASAHLTPHSYALPAPREVTLPRGTVHEWFAAAGDDTAPPSPTPRGRGALAGAEWTPPLLLLTHLARAALCDSPAARVVWIGRRCWPTPRTLLLGAGGEPSLLSRSLFADPPAPPAPSDDPARVWAIDLALRCPAVAAVVADASGLSMAASRRLQLAAEAGGTLGLLARPPWEVKALSAAATRWLVRPESSDTLAPRWSVELLRRKGVRPDQREEAPRCFTVELDREESRVAIPADVPYRPGGTAEPAWERERAGIRTA